MNLSKILAEVEWFTIYGCLIIIEEEESSDFPACHISEMVSSLVLKLGVHFVVGSSRLDNHSQYLLGVTRISLLY